MGQPLLFRAGALALLLATTLAGLHAAPPAGLTVSDAWVRATVPGQSVGAAYLRLTAAKPVTIARIRSDVAGEVQVHSMSHQDGIMRMRHVPQLGLAAGQSLRLAPGGMHLMLLELKRPLRSGEQVALELDLQGSDGIASTVRVSMPVRTRAPADAKP